MCVVHLSYTNSVNDAEGNFHGAENEIRSILWIEGLDETKLPRVAKETWDSRETLITSRYDRKNRQSLSLKNEIYQLVGFYIAFQGLLLTAVTQSNLLHCNNVWLVLALSLLASLVSLAGVLQKYRRAYDIDNQKRGEKAHIQTYINFNLRLITNEANFDWSRDAAAKKREQELGSIIEFLKLNYGIILVAVVLILFLGLFLASIRQITCNPGSDQVLGAS